MPAAPATPLPANGGQLELVSEADLEFDPQNPRLPFSGVVVSDGVARTSAAREADSLTYEERVIDWMLRNANITDLMYSIGTQGYFSGEPLIVAPGSSASKFCVIEGNRRLAAIRLLNRPELARIKRTSVSDAVRVARNVPKSVPCLKFTSREDVLHFLGFRHITGVQAWDALQKARYLSQLASSPSYASLPRRERYKQLAREIGSRPDYVEKLLMGLAVYQKMEDEGFYGISTLTRNQEEGNQWFGFLYTAVTSYSNIADYIGLKRDEDDPTADIKPDGLKHLAQWLFDEVSDTGRSRVGESRNLSKLNRVVANAAARERFARGASLDDADALAGGPLEAFREAVANAVGRLKLADSVRHLIDGYEEADVESTQQLENLAVDLAGAVRNRRRHRRD